MGVPIIFRGWISPVVDIAMVRIPGLYVVFWDTALRRFLGNGATELQQELQKDRSSQLREVFRWMMLIELANSTATEDILILNAKENRHSMP
jgi:hypothetical protein